MKKFYNVLFILGLTITLAITGSVFAQDTAVKSVAVPTVSQQQETISVSPLEIVNNPSKYLNKKVCMQSKFSKFSTLGLDYKPAFKSSENYISFLFLREDSNHNIPLSELKMFLPRKTAEKLPDVKEGDTVKVVGKVFSNALGDAWFETDSFDVIKK